MALARAQGGSFLSSFVLPELLARDAIWPPFTILPMLIYTLHGLFVHHLDYRH